MEEIIENEALETEELENLANRVILNAQEMRDYIKARITELSPTEQNKIDNGNPNPEDLANRL